MTNLDALLEFLAKEEPAKLELLAADPAAAAHRLMDYLPDKAPTDLAPDSQEAAEAATVEEQYLASAIWTWRRLSPVARSSLLLVFEKATGKSSIMTLIECLQIRQPERWLLSGPDEG